MTIFKTDILKTSIACFLAGVLTAAGVEAFAATPSSTHRARLRSIEAERPIAHGRARGIFEDALVASAIASGASPSPGPFYGRYYGYHGYPGRYPCCYYPQVFDRTYYPYYYIYRIGSAQPTWWDYPDHWRSWSW
jgi:hypothetical protein